MEFGVFIPAQQRGYHQTSHEVIANSVEHTVVAEQTGFDTTWHGEHHFNNYSLSPSLLIDNVHFPRHFYESLKYRCQQSDDSYLVKEVESPTDLSFEQLKKNLPVGSPNQVIDTLLEEIELLKPERIALQTQISDSEQKTMLKQIELWGDTIIPAVRKALSLKNAA